MREGGRWREREREIKSKRIEREDYKTFTVPMFLQGSIYVHVQNKKPLILYIYLCENVQLANNVFQGIGQLRRHCHFLKGSGLTVNSTHISIM